MKLSIAIALIASLTGVTAFTVSNFHHHSSTATSTSATQLQVGRDTLGFDTSKLYDENEQKDIDAQEQVTEYIRENVSKVSIRSDLGKHVLISGFDPLDPSSMMVLDFLNSEDAKHFPFTKIVAHVEDLKLAKKRMIGRNARYTGLLDKLDFTTPDKEDVGALVPSAEQLADVSSWVVHIGGGDMSKLSDIADAAEGAASVKNVAILVSGAQVVGGDALKEAQELLKSKATSFKYTLVVVPEWNNEPEALCAYGLVNVTDVSGSAPFTAGESFSREESLRIVTECLAIENAAGSCVVAKSAPDKKSVENRMIQSMREFGFTRIQEIEFMVSKGKKGYEAVVEETQTMVPTDKRTPEEKAAAEALKAKEMEERRAKNMEAQALQAKKEEQEEMATNWAKREYLRKSLKRNIPLKEEDFIEMVWDRAMFEAGLKQRTMEGLSVNESEERKAFKEAQNKKRAENYKKEMEKFDDMHYEDLNPEESKVFNPFLARSE